jgi:hypothetical protein
MTILVSSLLRYTYHQLHWDFITDLIASSFIDIHRLYVYHLPYFRAAPALHYSALLLAHPCTTRIILLLATFTHFICKVCLLSSAFIQSYVMCTTIRFSDLYWSMCCILPMINSWSSVLHPIHHNKHMQFCSHSYFILRVYSFHLSCITSVCRHVTYICFIMYSRIYWLIQLSALYWDSDAYSLYHPIFISVVLVQNYYPCHTYTHWFGLHSPPIALQCVPWLWTTTYRHIVNWYCYSIRY